MGSEWVNTYYTTTGSTITSDATVYVTYGDPAPPRVVRRDLSNLEWLDQRVDEMRVKL